MITLHGENLDLHVRATISFPNGFTCSEFADEGAESVRPASRESNEYVAVYVPTASVAAANFAALSHAQDDIEFSVTYPDGGALSLKNGIVSGTAKLCDETTAFFFTFRAAGSTDKAIARHAKRKAKRKAKHIEVPRGVTLH